MTTETASAEWTAWTTTARIVVADSARIDEAEAIVRGVIAEVDAACSRFRPDSELRLVESRLPDGVAVSPVLAHLVAGALEAAAWTDGDVDPTLGRELVALGYDRDFSLLAEPSGDHPAVELSIVERRSRWTEIRLDGDTLVVPPGVALDLGATAKAIAADTAARRVAETLDTGVLVSLGGDIATSGAFADGWQVLVQDLPADPAQQVTLVAGSAVATSSTQKRRWSSQGVTRHHILDPRLGVPAPAVWRSATVAAPTCLRANALSTAAIVRGLRAASWLDGEGAAARLVDDAGRVVTVGGWPVDDRAHEGVFG